MANAMTLTPADLIMALLVREDDEDGPTPTVSLQQVGAVAREVAELGMIAIKIFTSGSRRGSQRPHGEARDNLMIRAICEAKSAAPGVIVITETCVCTHTDIGRCYLTDRNGLPDHSGTIEAIAEQATLHANAGADLIGPATAIPGGVRRIRQALDDLGLPDIGIMPHISLPSRLHNAYHSSMPLTESQRTSQIDPAKPNQAVQIAQSFVDEGSDMLLLEPALFSADLLVGLRQVCPLPLAPFSPWNEYLRLREEDDVRLLVEFFTALKRSGADRILTPAATDIAKR